MHHEDKLYTTKPTTLNESALSGTLMVDNLSHLVDTF